MAKIIGIDLGTTNSCVAVLEGGEPVVIANAEGTRTTPSVVAFSKTGERMVGQVAKRQAVTNADRTIASIKRHMGEDYHVTVDGKGYTPQEISAMVLQKLKADAEAYLGTTVTEAVITVPAYFSDSQRQATKDAGKIAGLNVQRIINEPTAAALAYGLDKETEQKIMVYDLGGGTFDVSIMEIGDGVFDVLATNGDTHLGGDDFDQRIMDYLVAEFKKAEGIDLSKDRVAMQRLKEAAEKAKIELSGVTTSNVNLPYITADATGPKHLDVTISRAKFNELTADLVERTLKPVRQAMSDAGLKASDLDKVLLVGGSTRIPAVQEAVKNLTGKDEVTIQRKLIHAANGNGVRNVMLIGAGDAGRALAMEFANSDHVRDHLSCVIDDNPIKRHKRLCGVPIVGGRETIPEMVRQYKIHKIIFAISSCSAKNRKEILDILLLVREQTTVLFSTHILSDVERVCTDVALLNNGVVEIQGSMSEIKTRFRTDGYTLETANEADRNAILCAFPTVKAVEGNLLTLTEQDTPVFDVLRFVADQHIPLLRWERSEPTLESLFMEVTRK